ncbi:MAG: sulfatase-like hydrolase/transferase [Cyclobacteriaceae bacterium]
MRFTYSYLSTFFLFLLVAILGLSCQTKKEPTKADKPNVLWIVSEDNSPFLGCYGDDFATTPNLDALAKSGIRYENAFSPAPVCAPTRSSMITGMYANSLGTHQMRSTYPIPEDFKFYPTYLREAGYYCANRSKKDYNTTDQEEAWDESSKKATYMNRAPGQPFFQIINLGTTHESSVHKSKPWDSLRHDPELVPIPPYHPQTQDMKHDWAQYYDKLEDLDTQVGEILAELKDEGLEDKTIVFYYSDHGGVIGRSKRFMYESGLRVPFIVSLPEQFQHLATEKMGTTSNRFVNLVDVGPTLLNLLGLTVPENMQGKPFLGENTIPQKMAYGFRGRMDERFDLVRSARNEEYRYIKNYMPHRIYAQPIEYLWRAPSMRSWEQAYLNDELNEKQSAFFQEKPAEELYNIADDPHNVNNLADDPEYAEVLKNLRAECQSWQKQILDIGFIPEPMIERISKELPMYEYVRQGNFPLERIMETAFLATQRSADHSGEIIARLDDSNPIVRYWALVGCIILADELDVDKDKIKTLATDEEVAVRIVASEVLYGMGEKELALNTLIEVLGSDLLMARTMAVNLLQLMKEDALGALPAIKEVVAAAPETRNYDIRAAKKLVEDLEGYAR